jgi:hypothetical protein
MGAIYRTDDQAASSKPFIIKQYTLQEIQVEILRQCNLSDGAMMLPPDLWYSTQDHAITQSQRRWSLAKGKWRVEEDSIISQQDSDLFYVDLDTQEEHGNYIVALLHYFSSDRENDKPVSISKFFDLYSLFGRFYK